jgi:hypothetical protein
VRFTHVGDNDSQALQACSRIRFVFVFVFVVSVAQRARERKRTEVPGARVTLCTNLLPHGLRRRRVWPYGPRRVSAPRFRRTLRNTTTRCVKSAACRTCYAPWMHMRANSRCWRSTKNACGSRLRAAARGGTFPYICRRFAHPPIRAACAGCAECAAVVLLTQMQAYVYFLTIVVRAA